MRIALCRGDIKYCRFCVYDENGHKSTTDFTEVYFTVKKKFSDRYYLFQKTLTGGTIEKIELGDYQIKIEPQDTNNLQFGEYKFDIQIQYENAIKETFVGDFVIKPEVTCSNNERG